MALVAVIDSVQKAEKSFVITMHIASETDITSISVDNAIFAQTEEYTMAGIAVQPYGAIIYDGTVRGADSPNSLKLPNVMLGEVAFKPVSTADAVATLDGDKYVPNVVAGSKIEITAGGIIGG